MSLVPALLLVSACTGEFSSGREMGREELDQNPIEDDGILATVCGTDGVTHLPARRLTRTELAHSIADIFGVDVNPSVFPLDSEDGGFRSNRGQEIPAVDVAALFDAVESVAPPVAERVAEELGCALGDSGCSAELVAKWAPVLYRRPLEVGEEERLVAFAESSAMDFGADRALELTVQAMLSTPQFLYVTEVEAKDDSLRALSDRELLTRWSVTLFNSVPDAALLDLASGFDFSDIDERRAMLDTMLSDPRAERGLGELHVDWMGVDDPTGAKDADLFPDWNQATAEAAIEDVRYTGAKAILDGGTFYDLMTTRSARLGDGLDEIYGVSGDDGDEVELGEERSGILTRAGVLALGHHATPTEGHVVFRGLLVRRNFLCDEVPAPPPDIDPNTDRSETDQCAACHQFIDPIGFAFEPYDAIGAYQSDQPYSDTREVKEMPETGAPDAALYGEFDDLIELGDRLGQSEPVERCYTEAMFRYALRSVETELHRCAVDAVLEELGPNRTLREGLIELLASDVYRAVGPEAPANEEEL